jgi:hypothetical protein
MLCYGPYPRWLDVQERFLEMRELLGRKSLLLGVGGTTFWKIKLLRR